MGFPPLLQLIQNGEPVIAGVPNRPLAELGERTKYLLDAWNTASAGSAIFARGVTVNPATVVGSPVFWNNSTQQFDLGLSAVVVDSVSGLLETAPSAMVWGVVYTKASANLADVLLNGFAPLDITAALQTGETLQAGGYYLSYQTAGTLTSLKPPIAVPILRADGNGNVFVAPQWHDLLSEHTHLHFRLRPIPAGVVVPPASGQPQTIETPDPSIEGWLPADHPIFNGLAPARAVFGYNIAENKLLSNYWPPIPPEDAVLVQDGAELDRGPDGIVIIDRNGIWWTSDCFGQAPWPVTFSSTLEELSEWSESVGEPGSCYDALPWFDLYFTRYGFMTEQTVVTSLVSVDPRISVTCQNGVTPASVGALSLALNLTFTEVDDMQTGPLAIKTFNATNQTLHTGPVATGLYALSSNVTLTGEATVTRAIEGTPRTLEYGAVGIDVATSTNRELFVELVRLDGAEEEYVQDVMYLGFPSGELTSIRCRIAIPETLDVATPQMTLNFRLLGLGVGTLPPLTLTYRRIPAATTLTALPVNDTALNLTVSATLTAPQEYIDVTSDPFAVEPGDDILFTLLRNGTTDAYPFEVGVLRQMGLITVA